ncbi:MAG TPA: hypothetical protein PKC21_05390 [Oligoflexia bacterium]|nr:hypothetical protein [Oligoflexia bacterium]HMR24770.1 hypothetical protein [Oligoflexia bacterium]
MRYLHVFLILFLFANFAYSEIHRDNHTSDTIESLVQFASLSWTFSFENCHESANLYKESFIQSIKRGLTRLNVINPQLTGAILQSMLNRPLEVSCEHQVSQKADVSTHLYKNRIDVLKILEKVKNLRLAEIGFFHEFLHIHRVDNLSKKKHNALGQNVQNRLEDAVYACQTATYPFLDIYLNSKPVEEIEKTYNLMCQACALVRKNKHHGKTYFSRNQDEIALAVETCNNIDTEYFRDNF